MRALQVVGIGGLFLAPNVSAQSPACASSTEALQSVVHDFWAAYNRRDLSALDRVLDDRLLFVSILGQPATKTQFLAELRAPEGSVKSESAERMDHVRTTVAGNTAIVSFARQWTLTFKQVGVIDVGTSRMTETLICRDGRWRVLAFQETLVPNATRSPNTAAVSRYDDYVGRYRFGANGDGGEITVTRKGDKLFEVWGNDQPIELLPGKHDSFFARGFPWVERFVRDGQGRVVGIHYTFEDSEVEAKRIP
jgi:ketosteroid isomerase-like protein